MSGGYTKNELEDALVQALKPLSAEGGGYLRVLGVYGGDLTQSGLLPKALQMPAVLVSYASSTYRPGPCLYSYETLGFNVIVICRAGASPDAYKVLKGIRDILFGGTLGLDIMPLKLIRESSLSVTKEISIFAALYSLTQKVKMEAQGIYNRT